MLKLRADRLSTLEGTLMALAELIVHAMSSNGHQNRTPGTNVMIPKHPA
jgi:hypothetical protein